MKYLDKNGASHLVQKILSSVGISTTEYRYVTSEDGVFSFTIPLYDTNSIVEVYINGLRCVKGYDYSLNNSGVITTLTSMCKGTELFFVVTKIG